MKRIIIFSFLSFFALQVYADSIGECYRKAVTKAQVQECLKSELSAVKADYDALIERVLTEARSIDRRQKSNKTVVNNLMKSNVAFKNYLEEECRFVESSYGARGQSAGLSCRINLMRIRAASLEGRYLSRK